MEGCSFCGTFESQELPPQQPNTMGVVDSPSTAPSAMTNVTDDGGTIVSHSGLDSMDILAAVFFIIAALWLLLAIIYACLALTFLRIRARGELDSIYEEDFGRWYIFGRHRSERFYIPLGWLFRRYVQHIQRATNNSRSRENGNGDVQTRFITREERRQAMEVLLLQKHRGDGDETRETSDDLIEADTGSISDDEEDDGVDTESDPDVEQAVPVDGEGDEAVDSDSLSFSPDVCSICLGEYEGVDVGESGENCSVLQSPTCPHKFHTECILDWLQRHNAHSECPCCRVAMVREEDVWRTVKRLRREKRRKLRRERRKARSERRKGEEADEENPNDVPQASI